MSQEMTAGDYLTPRDRTFLADTVVDTVHDLGLLQGMTSKSVLDLVSEDRVSSDLLQRLLGTLMSTETKKDAISWNELVLELGARRTELVDVLGMLYSTVVVSDDPTRDTSLTPDSRLEILFHLVTAVQHKRLLQSKEQMQNNLNQEQQNAEDSTDIVEEEKDDESNLPITLPAHFTPEQREMVASCYELLRADYDNRLNGFYQRLQILQANFGCDNAAKNAPCLAVSASPSVAELERSLSEPVSISAQSQSERKSVVRLNVQDRGGRVDTADTRSPVMPEWTTERQTGRGAGRGGRGGGGGGRGGGGNRGRGGRGRGGGGRNNSRNRNNKSKQQS